MVFFHGETLSKSVIERCVEENAWESFHLAFSVLFTVGSVRLK